MKHIKLFESFKNISDNIEELSMYDYSKFLDKSTPEDFNENEISIIKTIAGDFGDIKVSGDRIDIDFYKDGQKRIHDMINYITTKSLHFRKFKDEWYVVQIYEGGYSEGDDESGYEQYLCDQLDGLMGVVDLINADIKAKPKKGIRNKIKNYFRKFEGLTNEEQSLDTCWKLANIGDIKPESEIYQYIQGMHHTNSDFWDGDLGDRIEEYTSYKLKEITISKIDLDEWNFDEDDVEDHQQMYLANLLPILILDELVL